MTHWQNITCPGCPHSILLVSGKIYTIFLPRKISNSKKLMHTGDRLAMYSGREATPSQRTTIWWIPDGETVIVKGRGEKIQHQVARHACNNFNFQRRTVSAVQLLLDSLKWNNTGSTTDFRCCTVPDQQQVGQHKPQPLLPSHSHRPQGKRSTTTPAAHQSSCPV